MKWRCGPLSARPRRRGKACTYILAVAFWLLKIAAKRYGRVAFEPIAPEGGRSEIPCMPDLSVAVVRAIKNVRTPFLHALRPLGHPVTPARTIITSFLSSRPAGQWPDP